jgi:hypothetical protein
LDSLESISFLDSSCIFPRLFQDAVISTFFKAVTASESTMCGSMEIYSLCWLAVACSQTHMVSDALLFSCLPSWPWFYRVHERFLSVASQWHCSWTWMPSSGCLCVLRKEPPIPSLTACPQTPLLGSLEEVACL